MYTFALPKAPTHYSCSVATVEDILLNGTFTVSPTADPDTVTIDAGTYTVDGVTLSLAGLTFPDSPPFPGGVVNTDLTFNASLAAAPTPEPSSFVLLGTGLIAAVGAARRKGFSLR